MLPNLVPGDDDNPPVDPADIIHMSLPLDTLLAFARDGITIWTSSTARCRATTPTRSSSKPYARATVRTRGHARKG